MLAMQSLVMVWLEAPTLAQGFVQRSWPLVGVSLVCGIGSLLETWRARYTRAALASTGAVAAVIWGWGAAQYPTIVPPHITSDLSHAPHRIGTGTHHTPHHTTPHSAVGE